MAAWLEEHLCIEVPEVKARDGQLEAYVPCKRKVPAAQGALYLGLHNIDAALFTDRTKNVSVGQLSPLDRLV